MEFPKHYSMTIQHNEHKNYYQTIEQYLEDNELLKDCISNEDLEICKKNDELWELRWYPSNPIGFYHIISYSLEKCLQFATEVINENITP